MEEKELFKSSEEILILQICQILKENNIAYVKRYEGIGSYLNMVCGANQRATTIYVSSEEYDKAINLIEILNNENVEYESDEIPEELKEIVDEEEMKEEINKYKNLKKTLYIWAPVTMLAIAIVAIIIGVIISQ